jgi:hypothetical protein
MIKKPFNLMIGICGLICFLLSIITERSIVPVILWGIVAVGNIIVSFIDFS